MDPKCQKGVVIVVIVVEMFDQLNFDTVNL